VSQENVEIVRAHFDAMERRDLTMPFVASDVVYRPTAMFTETRECRGLDEFRRFNEGWWEAWSDDFISHATSFRDYDDTVIVRVVFSGHARVSGAAVSGRAFHVCWLRDGRIVRIEDYTDHAEALKAVGLEE
jgi:ketosteroid isomerase-like protein